MDEYVHDIGTMYTLCASCRRPDGMVTSDGVHSMLRAKLNSAKRDPHAPSVMQKPRVIDTWGGPKVTLIWNRGQ